MLLLLLLLLLDHVLTDFAVCLCRILSLFNLQLLFAILPFTKPGLPLQEIGTRFFLYAYRGTILPWGRATKYHRGVGDRRDIS